MSRALSQKLALLLAHLSADSADTPNVRLQKMLMMSGSLMFIAAGAVWGLLYLALGEPLAGAIPLSYAIISSLSIVLFALTGRYHAWRTSQLVLILLLPWLLMLALGGFTNSSAVIIWSLLCPMSALLFGEPRHAPRWFGAYLAMVTLGGLIQPFVGEDNHLSPTLIRLFFVMNIGAVTGIVFVLLYYFVDQKNIFQQKADLLLLNILPPEIAAILKNGTQTIADHYAGVSVLFADVVNFTPLSAQMTPVEVVELLNEVFSQFDALAEQHGLEKIKTIGDCYMVAAGVPRQRPDHAHALVSMALQMKTYTHTHDILGRRLALRIGINSGPVVAGVIGRKKFSYDLWGDVVNTASRMESHGVGGAIQVTRATYELIKDDFICEPRGTVTVKGKGDMDVWLVLGAHHEQASAETETSSR